jgi:hypothetical protein
LGPGFSERTSGSIGQMYAADAPAGKAARSAGLGFGTTDPSGERYRPGSATNFLRQPWQQKEMVLPWYSVDPAALAGSIRMPQTGSRASSGDTATGAAARVKVFDFAGR